MPKPIGVSAIIIQVFIVKIFEEVFAEKLKQLIFIARNLRIPPLHRIQGNARRELHQTGIRHV